MAKENTVYLYGYVSIQPKIRVNEKNEFLSGRIVLTTIRRSYATQELILKGHIRWDAPSVFSRNPYIIKHQMLNVAKGDMLFVKGTLCTKEVPKRYICPNCGNELVKEEGVVVYVDPIYITKIESGLSQGEALEKLKSSDEISNQVFIMGTLCREINFYMDEMTGRRECQFQIASNRKRRILEDEPERRTDYPWVKSFGQNAAEYAAALHTNSSIYSNGAIQTRDVIQRLVCASCGLPYERPAVSTEIVPYFIEYLHDCELPEPKDKGEREGADAKKS